MAEALTELHNLKCAVCTGDLENPSQLSNCLHILCMQCTNELERQQDHNVVRCPKCQQENIVHSALTRISGIADSDTYATGPQFCDECTGEKKKAIWNCFFCGKNLCASCRAHHNRNHNLVLISTSLAVGLVLGVKELLHHGATGADQSYEVPDYGRQDGDTIDQGAARNLYCPVCEDHASCYHVKELQVLQHPEINFRNSHGKCSQRGHTECDGFQKSLKYFCKDCWIAVCGSCSKEGSHKLHNTVDLCNMTSYLTQESEFLKDKFNMLLTKCEDDVHEERDIDIKLEEHVDGIAKEMNDRKYRIIEDATQALERVVLDAQRQGQNIVADYRKHLEETYSFKDFIAAIGDTIDKYKVTNEGSELTLDDVAKYIQAFQNQEKIKELLEIMEKSLKTRPQPEERRLVLVDAKVIASPPLPLARLGTEWCSLTQKNKFRLFEDVSIPLSMIVTASDECFISCEMTRERAYDAIICHRLGKEPVICNVPEGQYFITQMKSKEIITSKTDRRSKKSVVQYNNGSILENLHGSQEPEIWERQFDVIKRFDYPTTSIVATSDNHILVCVIADDKKVKRLSYLILMTLQGKALYETVRSPGPNMISPDYVAVSNQGEICIADTEGSSIVVLNEQLEIKERLNFGLPTNIDSERQVFKPEGICYDTYGRIIVADPDNHTVVRLSRDSMSRKYRMEPLITRGEGLENFSYPKLVAMGPDCSLWVVCRDYVYVFEYCT